MDAGLQAQQGDSVLAGVIGEMIEYQLPEAAATVLGAHVHALELSIVRAEQLDAAAGGGGLVGAQEEEGHIFPEQLLDAEAVPALRGVTRGEVSLELFDQRNGVRRVGPFADDDRGHRRSPQISAWPSR